jgi:hypothetical protein
MLKHNLRLIICAFIMLCLPLFSCKAPPPLDLQIDSPADGVTVRTNLVKVSGSVSEAAASVTINGSEVSHSGTDFSGYVQLREGENKITVAAAVKNRTVEKTINMTFIPQTAVTLRPFQSGSDYATAIGQVIPPQSSVEVNGNQVEVNLLGQFTYGMPLSEGNNIFRATATYNGSTDTDALTIIVQDGLPPMSAPGQHLGDLISIISDDIVLIKAGEYLALPITYKSGKNIMYPEKHTFGFKFVQGYGGDEIPIPDGINIEVTPATLVTYSNTSYPLELNINTTPNTAGQEYWIKFYSGLYGRDPNITKWIKISCY